MRIKARYGNQIYAGGHNTDFTYKYSQSDYGTERTVNLYDPTGKVVASGDPFWPDGIPANLMIRQTTIGRYAARLYCQMNVTS